MMRVPLLIALALVTGCHGSSPPSAHRDGGAAPPPEADGWAISADATVDSGRAPDSTPKSQDGGSCPVVPAGGYAGKASGDRTGTVALEVRSTGGTLSLAATSSVTLNSKVYPLLLSSIVCGHLEAVIGAPAGVTGGTPFRGQIRADFRTSPARFEGDWNIAGSDSGTFAARK